MRVNVPGIPIRRLDGSVEYVKVDPDDFVWLNDWRWTCGGHGYAIRHVGPSSRGRYSVYMHRAIMGLVRGDGRQVDHANGDRFDNRRANLRIVTQAQNNQNRRPYEGKSSRFRGVSRCAKNPDIFVARAMIDRVLYHIGRFRDEEEAAEAVADFRRQHMPFSARDAA